MGDDCKLQQSLLEYAEEVKILQDNLSKYEQKELEMGSEIEQLRLQNDKLSKQLEEQDTELQEV